MIVNIERENTIGRIKPEVRTQVIDPTAPVVGEIETLALQELRNIGLEISKRESFLNLNTSDNPIAIETAYLQVLNTDPSQINFNDPETQNLIFGDTSTQFLLEDSSKIIQVITDSESPDKVGEFSLSLSIGSIAGQDAEGVIIQEIHPDNSVTYYVYDSTNALITPVTLPAGEKLSLFTRHENNGFDRLVVGVSTSESVFVLTSKGFSKEDPKNFSTTSGIDGIEPWQQGSTVSAVNLRSGAGSDTSVLKILEKGTAVTVIERQKGTDAAWYKVLVDGQIGDIRGDLLNINKININGLEKVNINELASYVFDSEDDLVLNIPNNSTNLTNNLPSVDSSANVLLNAPSSVLSIDTTGRVTENTIVKYENLNGQIYGVDVNGNIVVGDFPGKESNYVTENGRTVPDKANQIDLYTPQINRTLDLDVNGNQISMPFQVWMSSDMTSLEGVKDQVAYMTQQYGPAYASIAPKSNTCISIKLADGGADILTKDFSYAISKASKDGGKTVTLPDGEIWEVSKGFIININRNLPGKMTLLLKMEQKSFSQSLAPIFGNTLYVDKESGSLVYDQTDYFIDPNSFFIQFFNTLTMVIGPKNDSQITFVQGAFGQEVGNFDVNMAQLNRSQTDPMALANIFSIAYSNNDINAGDQLQFLNK